MPRKIPEKKLTLSLPTDVWDRLRAEALSNGHGIGGYARSLILKRDARQQKGDR